MNKTAIALLILGLVQMTGDILQRMGSTRVGPAIKGIGAATTASPKVFSAVRGLETFSTKFFIEWTDRAGQAHSLLLTPEVYARVAGPYQRRNVYGAALAYGPVLMTDERTRPMFESVINFALTGNAPLLRELGIDPNDVAGPVRVRYEMLPGTPDDLPRQIEVARP